MKLTPWMLTVGSFLVIALLATGFLVRKLIAREVPAPPRIEVRTLPMAISDIEPGTLLTRAHVGNGPWRDPELAPDTILSLDSIVGRIAREHISAAQPLRGSQFYAPGDQPELKVGENMRAVTINVGDETAMVNGLIKPGQYVDVILTVDASVPGTQSAGTAFADAITLTLFEGVKVIAMNRSYSQSTVDRGHNVTLELNDVQARAMLLASQKGTVVLSFNPNGPGTGGVQLQDNDGRVTLQQILGIAPAVTEDPFQSEHYRGGGHSRAFFQDGRRSDSATDGRSFDNGTPLQGGRSDWGWSTGTNRDASTGNVSQAANDRSL